MTTDEKAREFAKALQRDEVRLVDLENGMVALDVEVLDGLLELLDAFDAATDLLHAHEERAVRLAQRGAGIEATR